MKRQKVLKKRSFLLTDDDRLELLQQLAVEINVSPTNSITSTDAQKLVEKNIAPPKHELEAHTRDFLTNSFLIRTADEYRLSHKSILEYLVAMRLQKEIQSDAPEILANVHLQSQFHELLTQFEPNVATLIKWVKNSKWLDYQRYTYLGTNAAILLLRISDVSLKGKDLSGANLFDVNFSRADLRNSKLKDALLGGADLTGAKFNRRDIQGAKIENTFLKFYILKTQDMQKLDAGSGLNLISRKLRKVDLNGFVYGFTAGFRGDLFWTISTDVEDFDDFERIKNETFIGF